MTGSRPVRARLRDEARLVVVALQFLTRLPVPAAWIGRDPWDPRWLTDCVRHFPLVGALIGLGVAAVLALAVHAWPPMLAAALAVTAGAVMTGAFHEDGLADTFDALGGSADRDRALEIMKDSRLGTYGVLALVSVTALRVLALGTLAGAHLTAALAACLWSHALGRWACVVLMTLLPYGGDAAHAKARPLAIGVRWPQALCAAGWLLTVLGALAALAGHVGPGSVGAAGIAEARALWGAALLASGCAALVVLVGMHAWLQHRLGGYTGDALGATEQLTEAAVLLAMCAVVGAA